MSHSKYPVDAIMECCSKYRVGESVAIIIKEYGIPRSTIYYWIKQYRDLSDAKDISPWIELRKLKRKHDRTRQINEVLQSVNCTRQAPLKTKLYELEKLYDKYSVRVLCEALNVDRGTFYNHVRRNKKADTSYAKRRLELSDAIRKIYEESHGLFGSDKILSVLQAKGYRTSKQMVRQLMKEMGLKSFRSRAKKDFALWERLHETKNILHQDFYANEPNLVWVSDCTQFTLFQKTYYLCAILDLFSRKIIAYKISPKSSTQLMTSTLKMALEARTPNNRLLFHSDRGCQYTSFAFRKLLISNEITQSFSKSGNPYDNGAMESFFSSLKQEEIYRTSYRSLEDCKNRIAEYMKFYNEKRPHRANNYKTPNQTEELFYQRKKNRDV